MAEQPLEENINTNTYEGLLADIRRDTSLDEKMRWTVGKADLSAGALTREFQKLLEDGDLTSEARARRAEEAREYYAPRVRKERAAAKEALAKEAEKLERASMPRPLGQTLSPTDTQTLIADQNEAARIERQIERRSNQKGPFSFDIGDFLKSEYQRGISEGGVEGGAVCRGVLRVARERGIGEDWLNSLRSEEQLAKLDRARQLATASWMIPLEASNIPRSLAGPRRLSRRPEQNRALFMPQVQTEPLVKAEDASATVGTGEKKQRRTKRQWK